MLLGEKPWLGDQPRAMGSGPGLGSSAFTRPPGLLTLCLPCSHTSWRSALRSACRGWDEGAGVVGEKLTLRGRIQTLS